MTTARGTLFLVGTPIGNLGDLTLRAIETLRRVHHVAAEDTRRTRALLAHLELTGKRLHALDAHASERALAALVALLEQGEDVAVVTDAGMPAVSDPGTAIVRAAAAMALPIVVIPGPSAVTSAVALSGLVEGPFWFVGFLPRKGSSRDQLLDRIAATEDPVLLFEAPLRTAATLQELATTMPERPAVVARELTKLHEETHRGTVAELAQVESWRGEIVIVLGPSAREVQAVDDEELGALVRAELLRGLSVREVAAALAARLGRPRRELYALAQREQDCAKTGRPCSRR